MNKIEINSRSSVATMAWERKENDWENGKVSVFKLDKVLMTFLCDFSSKKIFSLVGILG